MNSKLVKSIEIHESILMTEKWGRKRALTYSRMQGLTVLWWENHKFYSHCSEDWIRQASSTDAKSRGRFCLGAWYLHFFKCLLTDFLVVMRRNLKSSKYRAEKSDSTLTGYPKYFQWGTDKSYWAPIMRPSEGHNITYAYAAWDQIDSHTWMHQTILKCEKKREVGLYSAKMLMSWKTMTDCETIPD